jgi:hypothetical protein
MVAACPLSRAKQKSRNWAATSVYDPSAIWSVIDTVLLPA